MTDWKEKYPIGSVWETYNGEVRVKITAHDENEEWAAIEGRTSLGYCYFNKLGKLGLEQGAYDLHRRIDNQVSK